MLSEGSFPRAFQRPSEGMFPKASGKSLHRNEKTAKIDRRKSAFSGRNVEDDAKTYD
jgi:hypothetical protein